MVMRLLQNFNCTIQELKLQVVLAYLVEKLYFNCTIQELKLSSSH